MSKLPYTLIKSKLLDSLQFQLRQREKEMNEATQFIKSIEEGNLDIAYHEEERQGKDNILASSLISMRNQMKQFSKEESERKWVSEGMAQFVDILRSRNEDISVLADDIIRHLVKYMEANQGALYIMNDDIANDRHLEMVACYAYNRKKFLNQRIEIGEGLTGQVVLEKETIYMTDVPQNYIHITSGLGEALPNCLLLVPLKIEEHVFGAVEIASFGEIKQHQIEFVEKLGESIASTISSVKTNERTKKLLHESQHQAEMMRSQEEEMRQNMEELSATQEEVQRVLAEVQDKEEYLNEVLNASQDSIYTIDREYKIVSFNKVLSDTLHDIGKTVEKGHDMLGIFEEGPQRQNEKAHYDRALKGERFEVLNTYSSGDLETVFATTYCPLKDKDGKVVSVAVFAKDTTELVMAQRKAEKSYKEAHEKELYMKNMLNATTDAILTVDKNLNIVLANNVMLKTFRAQGIQVDVGFHVTELAQKGKEEEFMIPYNKAFAGETVEMTRDYFDRHYLITYNPMYDDKGEVMGVSLFTKDITESKKLQKQAETLLAQSQLQTEELRAQEEEIRQNMEELSATQEEMQRHIIEVESTKKEIQIREEVLGLTTILSESDTYGNILYANDKLCQVSKYSKDELIGKPHSIFRHPDMPKELFHLMWTTIKRGEVFKGIIKNRAKDGSTYWVDATIMPVKDENGEIVKHVGARYHIVQEELAAKMYKSQMARLKITEPSFANSPD